MILSVIITLFDEQDVRNNPALLTAAKAATVDDGKSAKEDSKEKRRQKASGKYKLDSDCCGICRLSYRNRRKDWPTLTLKTKRNFCLATQHFLSILQLAAKAEGRRVARAKLSRPKKSIELESPTSMKILTMRLTTPEASKRGASKKNSLPVSASKSKATCRRTRVSQVCDTHLQNTFSQVPENSRPTWSLCQWKKSSSSWRNVKRCRNVQTSSGQRSPLRCTGNAAENPN